MKEFYIEIKKSFPQMEKLFTEKQLNDFINCSYNELCYYHFGLGTWIRNHLLEQNSYLYLLFIEYGITDKDDMSAFVIEQFYIYIHAKFSSKDR